MIFLMDVLEHIENDEMFFNFRILFKMTER